MDGVKVANQLNEIGKNILEASAELRKEKPFFTRKLTSRAEGIIRGQRLALKSVYDFYNGYDPQFSWWVTQPHQLLDSLLINYSDLIKSYVDPLSLPIDDGSGIIGNPIGRVELIRQLKGEMISYSPEKLIKFISNQNLLK